MPLAAVFLEPTLGSRPSSRKEGGSITKGLQKRMHMDSVFFWLSLLVLLGSTICRSAMFLVSANKTIIPSSTDIPNLSSRRAW